MVPIELIFSRFGNTDKVMRFVVGNTVSDNSNNGAVPSSLNTVNWPVQKTTVDHVFNFQHGGDALWTINGEAFNDVNNRVLARPPQVRGPPSNRWEIYILTLTGLDGTLAGQLRRWPWHTSRTYSPRQFPNR